MVRSHYREPPCGASPRARNLLHGNRLLVGIDRPEATLEWTTFLKKHAPIVCRGSEWYVFKPETRLTQEIRGYTAAPLDLHSGAARQELLDFDYLGRDYPRDDPRRSQH